MADFTNTVSRLPALFRGEPLAPMNKTARLHRSEVNMHMRETQEGAPKYGDADFAI